MQNRLRRSKFELRGPRSDLKVGPGGSGGVRSAPLCALNSMAAARSARRMPFSGGGHGGGAPPGRATGA
eukprot:5776063-Alexandrium_andersonii.AAC.2